jgi:hypothetical protein
MNLRENHMGEHVGGAEHRASIHLAQVALVRENGVTFFLAVLSFSMHFWIFLGCSQLARHPRLPLTGPHSEQYYQHCPQKAPKPNEHSHSKPPLTLLGAAARSGRGSVH